MLKAIIASLDEVPEAARALYAKTSDGRYKLEVEGMVDKAKLDEFRENNVALNKKLEDLSKQMESFKGVDPSKFKEYEEQARKIRENELIDKKQYDQYKAEVTAAIKKDFDTKESFYKETIKKIESERDKAINDGNDFLINAELRKATDNPEAGYQPKLADGLIHRVRREFTVKDGKVVHVNGEGSVVIGKDGGPMSIDEYLQNLSKELPWMLKPSSGSGAQGNNGKGAANGKTMKRADFNALDPVAQHAFAVAGKGAVVD